MIIDKNSYCLLCGVPTKVVLINLADNRFGSPDQYSIAECDQCRLLQTVPIPEPEEIKHFYETYYNFGGETGTIYTKLRNTLFGSLAYSFWMAIDGDISFHSRSF